MWLLQMRKLILSVLNFNLFTFKLPHVAGDYCVEQYHAIKRLISWSQGKGCIISSSLFLAGRIGKNEYYLAAFPLGSYFKLTLNIAKYLGNFPK